MALRTALGKALHGSPEGIRNLLPRALREGVRRRLGPFAPWEAGFVPRLHAPPAPGPGEVVGPPDFVGIGVQKAGTTWWFGLIAAHPDVAQPTTLHKERHYFAPYATRAFSEDDALRYRDWFPRPAGKLAGEWTPDYIYQSWVPPLLQQAAPDTRLLVVLRDPVDRFVSGLAHRRLRPGSHLGTVVSEAVERGFYAAALRRWDQWLSAGRALVLQYERCVAAPVEELARTYRFLGLDDGFCPPDVHRASNPTRQRKITLDADARRRLVALYRSDVAELAGMVPDFDAGLWPNFSPR